MSGDAAARSLPVWKHPAFRTGIADMAPVCVGLMAWGLMTGVAMVKSGMSLAAVLLMGVFVFAGSSQLAALPLMASGAPLWVILVTSFCVNLRFVVFSMHLRAYVMHLPLWRRLFGGYVMADMNYVLLVRRYPEPPTEPEEFATLDAYWAGSGATSWVSWVGASLVGIALGSRVPVSWGLGFAGILALIGVAASLVSTPLRILSAAVAAGAAVVTIALPLRLNILVAIVSAVLICLIAERSTPTSSV